MIKNVLIDQMFTWLITSWKREKLRGSCLLMAGMAGLVTGLEWWEECPSRGGGPTAVCIARPLPAIHTLHCCPLSSLINTSIVFIWFSIIWQITGITRCVLCALLPVSAVRRRYDGLAGSSSARQAGMIFIVSVSGAGNELAKIDWWTH